MLASWYVALKHDFPTKMPSELKQARKRILFARWLVLTGRLSDFGPLPEMPRRSEPVALFGWRSEAGEPLLEAA
jgi:hypothetical protein